MQTKPKLALRSDTHQRQVLDIAGIYKRMLFTRHLTDELPWRPGITSHIPTPYILFMWRVPASFLTINISSLHTSGRCVCLLLFHFVCWSLLPPKRPFSRRQSLPRARTTDFSDLSRKHRGASSNYRTFELLFAIGPARLTVGSGANVEFLPAQHVLSPSLAAWA